MIEATGEGKSAVATPDGKKPKEEEEEDVGIWSTVSQCFITEQCPTGLDRCVQGFVHVFAKLIFVAFYYNVWAVLGSSTLRCDNILSFNQITAGCIPNIHHFHYK